MTTASPASFNASSEPEKEECPFLYGTVWRKTYLTEYTYRNLVAITCINLASVLFTIVLNAMVIFVIATKRRLQTNSNILLACLAVTDLLTGLVGFPVAIAVDLKRIFGDGPFCTLEKLFIVASSVPSFASVSHLVLISVDRYIAIKYPLRYHDIVTKQRLITGVLLVWAASMLVLIEEVTFAVIDSDSIYMKVKDTIIFFICLVYVVVIIYTSYYIFSETRRQKKRIQTEQVTREEAKRMKKDNTLAIILAVLAWTYLPTIIGVIVTLSSGNLMGPGATSVLWRWVATSVMLGSLFNPLIYCWRIKKLRHAFLEILHFRQLHNRSATIEMVEIQRRRPEIQISSCEDVSPMPVVRD